MGITFISGGEAMKIGLIGAGKVGFSLGRYFCEKGVSVVGYYSRSFDSAKQAADFTQTKGFENLIELVKASDTLFITTPDGEIENVWDDISKLPIENKIICHCSGSLASTVFSDIEDCKAYGYSIHPLYAINSKEESYKYLEQAYFSIEGDLEKMEEIKALFCQLGNPYQIISKTHKTLYHAAAVTVSNQMIALLEQGVTLMKQCGFEETHALKAIWPLVAGNIQNVCDKGLVGALTGPVERGDIGTVKKHMEALTGSDRNLYRLLSLKLLNLAKIKYPHQDYEELIKLLEEKNSEEYSDNF